MDYLETRKDVDASRVGIIAMSLGGYYAPRAAAFEKRLACCVAWGARFENTSSHGKILRDPQCCTLGHRLARSCALGLWGKGRGRSRKENRRHDARAGDREDHLPDLVLHGENDRQVPLEQAQLTIDRAVNSPRRDLRILTAPKAASSIARATYSRPASTS